MIRRERVLWRSADSLPALCALTQRWLLGELEETPGHLGPPAEETASLVEDLVALNRAGFLTTGSQPGLAEIDPTGRRYYQRAFVEGYTTFEKAAAIADACRASWGHPRPSGTGLFDALMLALDEDAGLECHLQPVEDMPSRLRAWSARQGRRGAHTPVTISASPAVIHTEIPHTLARSGFDLEFGGVGRSAGDALEASVRVAVVDTGWCDTTTLWQTLTAAVRTTCAQARPRPRCTRR